MVFIDYAFLLFCIKKQAIKITRYQYQLKDQWNAFLADARNGEFFFHREYLSYHKDRITDHSLLFYKNETLLAILPGMESENNYYSHNGLTFGGVIVSKKCRLNDYNLIYQNWINYLITHKFRNIQYKPQPAWHSLSPESFFIDKFGFTIHQPDLTFLIDLSQPLSLNQNRIRNLKKAPLLTIKVDDDYKAFYKMLEGRLLEKYGARPLHTFEELIYLKKSFPGHIELISAFHEDQAVGHLLLYKFRKIIKTQYIIADKNGYEMEAITQCIKYLYHKHQHLYNYLDLGTANSESGGLNTDLVRYKESLGASPASMATYTKNLI